MLDNLHGGTVRRNTWSERVPESLLIAPVFDSYIIKKRGSPYQAWIFWGSRSL